MIEPEPDTWRRHSHSTPWVHRNSFLLESMIDDENFSVYESRSFFSEGNYNIISLRECQGFIFNQDLFALPYQQLRSTEHLICGEKRRLNTFHDSRPPFIESDLDDDDVDGQYRVDVTEVVVDEHDDVVGEYAQKHFDVNMA